MLYKFTFNIAVLLACFLPRLTRLGSLTYSSIQLFFCRRRYLHRVFRTRKKIGGGRNCTRDRANPLEDRLGHNSFFRPDHSDHLQSGRVDRLPVEDLQPGLERQEHPGSRGRLSARSLVLILFLASKSLTLFWARFGLVDFIGQLNRPIVKTIL